MSETGSPSRRTRWSEAPKRLRKAWVVGLAFLLISLAGWLVWKTSPSPFANDPNLVRTTPPTISFATSGMSWRQKLFWKYYEWKRSRFPNPLSYSFPGGGKTRCSIHGLLNQCMEVSGTQYLIEKNVAAGSVDFGATNVLNGEQWVAAFENSLLTGTPEWWNPESKGFQKENLVLLRYHSRTILVLSAATAQRYLAKHPDLQLLN